ncbi:MAG TPA: alkaline phosphatase family protein [Gemmatimonadaceae bacterium]|nr:alkaline phosphatase family protein [Gemmatimonadaceae bacterium]
MTTRPFLARLPAAASTAALLIAASCASAQPAVQGQQPLPPAPADVPTLVVFITIDQLLPEYFERFGALTGGLGRLHRGGAVFTNAFHDHANTETAPGHASTMSGRFPASTGIVSNSAGVQDPQAPLIGAPGPGASPFRFRGTTLTDWLRIKDPTSRALSVSRKDRGAIFPIGRDPQEVYWYASNGMFTTSKWYRDTLPSWVQQFNARRLPESYAGREWTLLLDESAYPEPDSLEQGSARGNVIFPHVMSSTLDGAAALLPNFPWMDEVTMAFALHGVQALQLGEGPQTDVLAISLSATDAVGHAFGPDSREVHDHILRLDRMVGVFLDSLFQLRDSTRVVIALTSDHGVAPYPKVREQLGRGAAVYYDSRDRLQAFAAGFPAARVPEGAVTIEDGVLLVDRPALARAGVNADSIVTAFISMARDIPGVARVDRLSELARADTASDFIARRWLNMLPPDMPAEAVITPAEYAVPLASTYAQHGSPYDYDTHVPVIFYGRPFRAGRYDEFARVVDMAPTLAWVTATTPLERLDGRVLRSAIR